MTAPHIRPRRSLLFVPALRPDRYWKALDSGADIVCADMEDAVAIERKDEGRANTLPLFKEASHPQVERMMRINSISRKAASEPKSSLRNRYSPKPPR